MKLSIQSDFPPEAIELVGDAEQLGAYAYVMLQHMAGSDAEHIPHQIVRPFQRWADSLGIKNDLFFRADHVANYELRPTDLRAFIKRINSPSDRLKDAAGRIRWPILRVTVPSQALGMLPHFAVVAHELGHAIQDEILIDLTDYEPQVASVVATARNRLELLGLSYGMSEQIELQGIIIRWLNELKADAVGLYLVGPAFYFALSGFLELSGHGLGIGTSHPPSQLRRQLLMDRLNLGGADSFTEVFKAHSGIDLREESNSPNLMALPEGDELFDILNGHMKPTTAAICVALIPFMTSLGQEIYAAVESRLARDDASIIYTPERLRADLSAHLKELVELVPPIEARPAGGEPVATSLAGILNVGWAALLGKLNDISVPSAATMDPDTLRMERLHDLLLKAVELSEARQLWSQAR